MNFLKKWYTYQKERFPVLMYGIYIFAIVFGVFCMGNFLVINEGKTVSYVVDTDIYYYKLIPMFFVAFLQFLMVRIVDEFKDYEEDCKYRAYRPVPRGLITLKELKVLFIISTILQFLITYIFCKNAIIMLFIVWIFFAIMSKGFFIKKILDKHLLLEVTFDELLMPILAFFLLFFPHNTVYSFGNSESFYIFLFMTYVISWIVEIARKVRSKECEEKGVKTYTAVFGIKGAMLILFLLETLLMLVHYKIIGNTNIWIVILPYLIANISNFCFVTKQSKRWAQIVSLLANSYILICYFSLGVLIL